MVHMLMYLLALLVASGYAFSRGGTDERCGAIIIIAGSLLTLPAGGLNPRWEGTQYAILAIDIAALIAFFLLAALSDRFWPLWITAFHLVAVLTHVATITSSAILPKVYMNLQPIWAYPMLLTLCLGSRTYWLGHGPLEDESASSR
ncbi:hypothetical protein [Edaphosphingomonas haloaromaticamans]|uniref:YhhN-like protein n=1 Tax=Edaphosphingomonas haloaromaticamans TaxID=653954 RepID=A0A1S1HAK6_9SPHN|nr:hypothetical protein [Sphingomonas haloaromaticamans]OHT19118.1 hypothetical protein BHE75_01101 [Sphingomonas haloaromaticamans]